jgi:Skp family chaperone for outer membrane proteins
MAAAVREWPRHHLFSGTITRDTMIRHAPILVAAAFGLFVASNALAQSGAPAVTPANCKEPVVPKQPASTMTSEELNALTKQYQAAVKDGNSRYMQCASDADWGKFQKKVEAYGSKLNAEVAAFNKTNGRPQATPASCTAMKPVVVPAAPTREQLVQIQNDLKVAQADFNDRYAKCAATKDAVEAKTNIEKSVAAFNAKAQELNAETQRVNAETQKANEEALKKQEESASKRGNPPAGAASNSSGTRY